VYSIGLIIDVRERKFQGTKVQSMELSFSGAKVLGYESSSYCLGSAVSSPTGVWGRAPAKIEFGTF